MIFSKETRMRLNDLDEEIRELKSRVACLQDGYRDLRQDHELLVQALRMFKRRHFEDIIEYVKKPKC